VLFVLRTTVSVIYQQIIVVAVTVRSSIGVDGASGSSWLGEDIVVESSFGHAGRSLDDSWRKVAGDTLPDGGSGDILIG
jgi:hypothetical protein